MAINPRRIAGDIETIAGFNESRPTVGFSRPTFSPAWRSAVSYIVDQAAAAGCKTRIDAAGNLHARPKPIDWPATVWLSGSHIDSVPTGGKFDGVVGVVAALEVLRSAREAGQVVPLELIVFAEEEGTTFGLGMIGSRLWTGAISPDALKPFLNTAGKTFMQAGQSIGVRPEALAAEKLKASQYRGFIEVHIEQGPAMSETRTPIAVVTAIAGRKQYRVELNGVPNHAGSTPMKYRSDALTAAARMIIEIEKLAATVSEHTVATVGRIECEPNAINVIPGSVRLTIDLRSPLDDDLSYAHDQLQQIVKQSTASDVQIIKTEDQPAMPMHAGLVNLLQKYGNGIGPEKGALPTTTSGALHDAAILAPILPTAMLFIASKDGISHNPAELSRIDDIAGCARIIEKLVQAGA